MEDQQPILDTSANYDEIPLEYSLDQKGGMSIDSAGFTEDIVSLLTFLAILIIALFSGYFGPKPSVTEYASEIFQNSTNNLPSKLGYSISNLSNYAKYLTINIIMEKKPNVNPTSAGLTLSIESSKKTAVGDFLSNTFQPIPAKFNGESLNSDPITIYRCQSVNYSLLTAQLSFTSVSSEYSGVKIIFEIGNAEFVLYEMLFRIFFSISLLCFLILFYIRLRTSASRNWYLEQKLTLLLLLIIGIYNNPFYGLKFVKWSINYVVDAFGKGLAVSFTIYFLLALFDSFRFKNKEANIWFYLPKAAIATLTGLLILTEGLLRIHVNHGNTQSVNVIADFVQALQKLISPLYCISFIYVVFVIGFAMRDVDPTERYKLNLYVLTLSICFLAGLIGYNFRRDNALTFTIQHAIISLFAILMTYFHWPYEVKKDLIYGEQNVDNAGNQPETKFIINEDSDN